MTENIFMPSNGTIDDGDASCLMELYNAAGWLTRSEWATLAKYEPDGIENVAANLLADGIIVEVEGKLTTAPRAREVLERHGLGFALRA